MSLSNNDLVTFAAAINATTSLASAIAAKNEEPIINYFNTIPSSPVEMWNPSVPLSSVKSAIDWTAGTNGFQTLTATKQQTYLCLTADGANLDAAQVNIRNAFSSIFPTTVSSALQVIAQTPATNFEALFTTSGVCSHYGYYVDVTDVAQAMGW